MSAEKLKHMAAAAALDYIESGAIVGVGTGSTVDFFIRELAKIKSKIDAAVASSVRTQRQLAALNVPIVGLNATAEIGVYIDGADEADHRLRMIKGGGGALTREKIVAQISRRFVCIADESKYVERLGRFPLPIEVIPMARGMVAREVTLLQGTPRWREGFVTDNGNEIIDVANLDMTDPRALEETLNQIPGVVTVGLFARRAADVLLLGRHDGVETLRAP